MDNQNGGKKLITIIVIIIVVVVALAVWLSFRSPNGGDVMTPEQLSFSAAQEANKNGVLEIPDQFPGNVVYVAHVELPAGGWVVIRKRVVVNNEDGQPGEVVGATYFDKDTRIGNVDLTEPLLDGQYYFAEAWTDNGDTQFSTTTDKIITKADGTVLQLMFKATKDLPEKKG